MALDSASPIVIEGDRWKVLWLLLPSAGFVLAGWFMVSSGLQVAVGIASIAFFGTAALVALILMLRPPRLTLTEDGIDGRHLRSWHMAWDDVAAIRLKVADQSAAVAIDYREDARPPMTFGRRRAFQRVPGLLRLSPEDVRGLLAERWAATRTGPSALEDPAAAPPAEVAAAPRQAVPWVSAGLVVVLALVFAAEIRFPLTPATGDFSPSTATLAAFGGSSRALTIGQGQWFRFMLAPVLHANLAHLLGNCAALLWAGWLLERMAGRRWFAAIYAVGSLAGEAVSVVLNPADTVDVGASGAIMALFAATYVMGFHYRGSVIQSRMQGRAIGMLGPAIFTMGQNGGDLKVNVWAHLGGAAAGALIAVLLLRGWSLCARHPPGRRLAAAVAGIACAAVLVAVWPAADDHERLAAYSSATNALAAGAFDAALVDIQRLTKRRPRDADGWMLEGAIQFARGDAPAALAAFRTAYALAPTQEGLRSRGLAAFYSGDVTAAVADLQRAATMADADRYTAIWLDLVRERGGLGPNLIAGGLDEAKPDWPLPVEKFFVGAISADELITEAAGSPRTPSRDEMCEAGFYVAEWDMVHGRPAQARHGFAKALQECPSTFTESGMARSELARADPSP